MAHSRKTDPATSHDAGAQVEASRKAARHRDQCFAIVLQHPEGWTAPEIAEATGLQRHEPSRRLPELEDAGKVRKGPSRRCNCHLPECGGGKMVTWLPVIQKPVQQRLL